MCDSVRPGTLLALFYPGRRRRRGGAMRRSVRAAAVGRQRKSRTKSLLEALENRITRLRSLARLNQLVSSSLDLGHVLEEITSAAAQIMQAPLATFWMVDREGRGLDLIAVSGERTCS